MSESWESRLAKALEIAKSSPDDAETEMRAVRAEMKGKIGYIREVISQSRQRDRRINRSLADLNRRMSK